MTRTEREEHRSDVGVDAEPEDVNAEPDVPEA